MLTDLTWLCGGHLNCPEGPQGRDLMPMPLAFAFPPAALLCPPSALCVCPLHLTPGLGVGGGAEYPESGLRGRGRSVRLSVQTEG